MNRKILFAAMLAAGSLLGLASTAQAAPAVVAGTGYPGASVYTYPGQTVLLQSPPPAPIYESPPDPRPGFVWSPGHWTWDNGRYAWQGGRWMTAQPGYSWQPPHWEQRVDGSWYLTGGAWVRTDSYAYDYDRRAERGPNGDMDHDGIRNADDEDRDGDGVANWDDDFPNNPNRS